MLALLLLVMFQTPPVTAQPGDFIAWDYADKYLNGGFVTRFRVAFDAGPAVDVPLTSRVTGTDTYRVAVPSIIEGAHVAVIVACNATSFCSPPIVLAFTVGPIPPTAVANARVTKAGGD
jgi:hypothetical protein